MQPNAAQLARFSLARAAQCGYHFEFAARAAQCGSAECKLANLFLILRFLDVACAPEVNKRHSEMMSPTSDGEFASGGLLDRRLKFRGLYYDSAGEVIQIRSGLPVVVSRRSIRY